MVSIDRKIRIIRLEITNDYLLLCQDRNANIKEEIIVKILNEGLGGGGGATVWCIKVHCMLMHV